MDEAIIRYVRRKHDLLIGEANAERIKIEAGTAYAGSNGRAAEVHIRGRDLRKGWAKSAVLTRQTSPKRLPSRSRRLPISPSGRSRSCPPTS